MNQEKQNFTKSYMSVVIYLYFIGALLGGVLVGLSAFADLYNQRQVDPQMFIAYAAYLGGPTATAIGFYAWKSKSENLLKIQQGLKMDCAPIDISVLANMGGNT